MAFKGSNSGKLQRDRVCIIGAGPAGMSAVYQYAKLSGENLPEVTCYEKQDTWGGTWNFNWMTGSDAFGEICHNGMYKHLCINAPKENFEVGDYTYKEHFGKPVPSYLSRAPMRDYMEGLWTKASKLDLKTLVKFNHAVRYVTYDKENDTFHVSVVDLRGGHVLEETFSHVMCAPGIFSTPYKPNIPGIEDFQGKVIHSHDFRDARDFKEQRVLVVGGSWSAEDISLQCVKFGAKSVVFSWHGKPKGLTWPKGIEEDQRVKQIMTESVVLDDGKTVDVDAIILCTGYLYSFPFLEEGLKLRSQPSLYPDNLYKGLVWVKGGNGKMFYLGVQNQFYTLPMFNVQAALIWRFITGSIQIDLRNTKEMRTDIDKWLAKASAITKRREGVEYQSQYLDDLIKMVGFEKSITNVRELFRNWLNDREADMATFRDQSFTSIYTGQKAAPVPVPWMQNYEGVIEKTRQSN